MGFCIFFLKSTPKVCFDYFPISAFCPCQQQCNWVRFRTLNSEGNKKNIPKLFIFALPDLMEEHAFSRVAAQSDHYTVLYSFIAL